MSVIVTGALAALTAAILWLGTKVTDLSERMARVETKIAFLVDKHGG